MSSAGVKDAPKASRITKPSNLVANRINEVIICSKRQFPPAEFFGQVHHANWQ